MCNSACLSFISKLPPDIIRNSKVLEVGSYNVNGSASDYVKQHNPSEYIGVDIVNGPGVDKICSVEDIVNVFGKNSFDIVICTEMLEHVQDWRLAINNLKEVCCINGVIIITTRSVGFPKHDYPADYWRFSINDMLHIFSDFNILHIEPDPILFGVFVYAVKKTDTLLDLTNLNVSKVI